MQVSILQNYQIQLKQSTANLTLDDVTKELLASQERLALYRYNLTVAKRRIPNNLLFIIDPNFPFE
jgi:hypothetical protein